MTPTKSEAADDEDYRLSHQARGSSYDGVLAAAPFDSYMARLEKQYLQGCVKTLFKDARPRYLDFACGTGRITQTVAPLCAEAVGVDISDSMLEQARRKCAGVRFVHADLTRSEVDLGHFDLATAFRFFGNAQDELRETVLHALRERLRPQGVLILNSHRNPHALSSLLQSMTGESDGMDLHYFKLRSLLQRHGFHIEEARPIGVWMYRSRLLNQNHAPDRAARLERRFSSPWLAPIAPDVVVVARRL
jgi:ubiquinone/menaquinone biosynthesis C-methylase UbiE